MATLTNGQLKAMRQEARAKVRDIDGIRSLGKNHYNEYLQAIEDSKGAIATAVAAVASVSATTANAALTNAQKSVMLRAYLKISFPDV